MLRTYERVFSFLFHLQGWPNYLADEPTHFMNLDLTWSLNKSIPSWLQGSYVSGYIKKKIKAFWNSIF